MKRRIIFALTLILFTSLLTHCGVGSAGSSRGVQVVNVSAYDPKEKQRAGRSYSPNDVSALRDNGAMGLIARCGKGGVLDEKCATFLASADQNDMLVGAYYRTIASVDAVAQADQFVNRMTSIGRSRSWKNEKVMMCADFDTNSSLSHMTRFLDQVKERCGVDCVVYLENSERMRVLLNGADEATKNRLRRCPYWAALYSHDGGACKCFPAPVTATGLAKQYDVWNNWSFWQYGGVNWEGGRSSPKVYRGFSPYFGNLDRPVERNVFSGSHGELNNLWNRHGLTL